MPGSILSVPANSLRGVRRIFYGWWIVVASFALNALSSGLLYSGFGIYFVLLREELGWSRAFLSSGFAVLRVESAFLGPFEGWVIDKFGPRIVVLVGVLFFGAGFMAFSQIQSIFWFFFSFILLAIGSSLAGFVPLTTTIAHWFARRRGLAMGIAMTGIGLGGGLIVRVLAWSVTAYGWRTTAFASGLLVWIIGIPAGLVLRHRPEPYGYLPDGRQPPPSSREEGTEGSLSAAATSAGTVPSDGSFSAREALRTRAFWLICAGQGVALLVIAAVSIHQVQHMVQRMAISLETAGSIVSLMLITSVIGQGVGGYLADRWDKGILMTVCMLGHMAGLLVLAYATTLTHLVLFAIPHGLAMGVRTPTFTALLADYFGRESYGTIIGFYSLFVMVPMTISPILTGWWADTLGGSYTLPFTVSAVLAGSGSVFFLLLRKPVLA